ncbi:MAG: sulfur oxidation c-type cytochrome SoxX [Pseudomonadota bacterium]
MYRILAAICLLSACSAPEVKLVPVGDIVGDRLPEALTGSPGNIERGRTIFSDRDQGHCVLCHIVSELDVSFQGNVGPALSTVGNRLDAAQLRLRIVDYQIVRPSTLMPSYYRTHDLYQVAEAYQGDPVLEAQQVEDLVAYLSQLRVGTDVAHE